MAIRRRPWLTLAALVLAAPLAASAQQPVKGGELVFAAAARIDSLDPHTTSFLATRQILNNLYDPLVRQKPGDPRVYPGLATAWKVSEDRRSYVFTLRKDVKFHDGTPFNAAAVCFTFDRIVNPETQARVARGSLGPYRSCDVVDEHTAKVNFNEPYAPFLSLAALEVLAPVSPTAARKHGADFSRNPVGTGPFMLKEWVPQQHARFVRNPDYAWPSPVYKHQGPAYLDGFVWKEVPEHVTRMGALRSGEAHIAEAPPAPDYEALKADARFVVTASTVQGTPLLLHMNTRKAPTSELAVRRAMQHAVNQELVSRTLYRGMYDATRDLLDPTTAGYEPSVKTVYRHDPARARELLEAAGWKAGPDGIRVKDGKRLEIVFMMNFPFDAYTVGPLLQAQAREVGIDLQLRKEAMPNYLPLIRKGAHHAGDSAWAFPDPQALRQLYHSANAATGFNYAHYENAEVDKLLDEGMQEFDAGRRAELYKKVQRIVMNDAVSVPLRRLRGVFVASTKVKDVGYSAVGFPLFYDAYLEK
jgi:peptide/nickel transport system substrate-binding protein